MCSLHNIGEVVLSKHLLVLLESNTKAVKEIICVSLGEHGGIGEAGSVGSAVSVILNSFDNVSESLLLESLLSEDGVDIIALDGNIGEVSLINISGVHWMSHKSLVVRNWPGWGRHNSQGVVSIWVDRSEHSILGRESSLGN